MIARQRDARVAGFLYLVMAAASTFSLAALPSWLLGVSDASGTVERILASPMHYRIGILCDLVAQIAFVALALVLYELLKVVDRRIAAVMVALVLVQVPMGFANLLLGLAPLVLLSGADHLSAFNHDQLEALVAVALSIRGHGIKAIMVYWGLWLLPFGILVLRSNFLPRTLGVLLVIGCFGHVVVGAGSLLFPAYESSFALLTGLAVGEILVCLWLLIKGARPERPESKTPSDGSAGTQSGT